MDRGALAWAAVALAAYAGMAALGDLASHLAAWWGLVAVAGVAAWGASRRRLGVRAVFAVAVIARALLLFTPPTLSDDIYRYVWEGRVQRAGHNPYVLAPDAPELAPLRDATVWPRVNHPDASAIYPPFAQLVFRGAASAGAGVGGFKVLFVLCDLGVVACLAALLRRRRRPTAALALYAWNPLAVVEVAGSGHLEPLAILPLAFAMVAAVAPGTTAAATTAAAHRTRAWVALACSVGAKYVALLGAPFLARVARPRPRDVGAAAAALVLFTLPYFDAGAHLFDSLRLYFDAWRYNDLAFRVLHAVVPSLWGAKLAAAGLVGAVLVWRLRRGDPPEVGLAIVLWTLLVLSPTVHPWYLLWGAFLLPVFPVPALFAWSVSVSAAYAFLYGAGGVGPAPEGSWLVRGVEIAPPLAVAAWGAWAGRRRRAR